MAVRQVGPGISGQRSQEQSGPRSGPDLGQGTGTVIPGGQSAVFAQQGFPAHGAETVGGDGCLIGTVAEESPLPVPRFQTVVLFGRSRLRCAPGNAQEGMPCSVFRVVRQEKGYSSFFNVCLEFFPHFRARWRPVPNDHGLGGQISLSFPRIAGHRGFPAGQAGRGGHQGKGFPHFSRRTENQDVGERPGGEGEEGNVIPDEVVMRKRNEAEAGFLALRQGDFFPDGGVFPCQLQRGSGGGVIHGKLHRHVLRLVGIEPLPQHFHIQHQFPVIYLSLPDSDAAVAFRPVAEGHDADGRGQGKGGQPLAHTGPERGVWLPGRGLHVRGNPDFRLSCAGFFQVRDGFLQKCRNICASIRCLAYSQVRQGFRSGNLGNGSSGGIKQGKAAVAELRESGFHQRGDGIPKGAGFVRMGIHGGGTIQNQQDFIPELPQPKKLPSRGRAKAVTSAATAITRSARIR